MLYCCKKKACPAAILPVGFKLFSSTAELSLVAFFSLYTNTASCYTKHNHPKYKSPEPAVPD
jgi:hypothetical protein